MNQEIQYIRHKDIDTRQWDYCIGASVNRLVYGYSWYLDIVAGEWDALVLGNYDAVFPLPFRKKAGIKYLYQPPFTQQLGVFSRKLLTKELVNHFLNQIPADFKLVEINLNTFNRFDIPAIETSLNKNFLLDLISPYDDIQKKYSDNLKRNLKKAQKNNLALVNEPDIRVVTRMFENNKGQELGLFKHGELSILQKLFRTCSENGIASLQGATTADGNLCAASLFLDHFDRSIFLFSAATTIAKETGAIPFLIDNHIRKYTGTAHSLDFEGSNDPDLARFYRSFGSAECNYFSVKRINLNNLQKFALHIYKKVK
jgi:hypothetical protein